MVSCDFADVMTVVTREMAARREFSQLSLELKVADVCPGCGQHIIPDVQARLNWLNERDTRPVRCMNCGISKAQPTASNIDQP